MIKEQGESDRKCKLRVALKLLEWYMKELEQNESCADSTLSISIELLCNQVVDTCDDPSLEAAIRFVITEKKPYISALQRTLNIGYGRVGRLMEVMEDYGIVTPLPQNSRRKVIGEYSAEEAVCRRYSDSFCDDRD
jgi:DNA segregation ATPase FtsK/SpoIIIE-like protein